MNLGAFHLSDYRNWLYFYLSFDEEKMGWKIAASKDCLRLSSADIASHLSDGVMKKAGAVETCLVPQSSTAHLW